MPGFLETQEQLFGCACTLFVKDYHLTRDGRIITVTAPKPSEHAYKDVCTRYKMGLTSSES
ncbi:hypothetical protein PROAA_1910001 [Candidatus Propionivibrio aalborgensis]|uniref:Uncharacterized protein n=1 Tax=Candidatus Propionivibrio aalborgensis TaxID=1860101 RepID=A0A1A8XRI3_9RHOO|nr:hypothetical protein PROAA_1910001 [Candidatus Propionivibrio aalborgensis]